jgi:hypothetical protein
VAIVGLVTFVLRGGGRSLTIGAIVGTVIVALSLAWVVFDLRKGSVHFTRNFYGTLRVKEGPTLLLNEVEYPLTHGPARVILSGQIYHGLQFTNPAARSLATTYYCEEGGLGLTFRELPAQTNRHIGAVGLGAGTLATYARPGDHIRFYEINPADIEIAQNWFTFLRDSPARIEFVVGDGRLSLEREPAQNFDLLVLDAFSGDSIPVHLLTNEAMQSYSRHLKASAVIAVHISNSHLDLEPVVRALAEKNGFAARLVPPKMVDPREGKLASVWMLLSSDADFLSRGAIAELPAGMEGERKPLLWTDDYSAILPILH